MNYFSILRYVVTARRAYTAAKPVMDAAKLTTSVNSVKDKLVKLSSLRNRKPEQPSDAPISRLFGFLTLGIIMAMDREEKGTFSNPMSSYNPTQIRDINTVIREVEHDMNKLPLSIDSTTATELFVQTFVNVVASNFGTKYLSLVRNYTSSFWAHMYAGECFKEALSAARLGESFGWMLEPTPIYDYSLFGKIDDVYLLTTILKTSDEASDKTKKVESMRNIPYLLYSQLRLIQSGLDMYDDPRILRSGISKFNIPVVSPIIEDQLTSRDFKNSYILRASKQSSEEDQMLKALKKLIKNV